VHHLKSAANSAEEVLLNKPQIYGGAPKLDCYRSYNQSISTGGWKIAPYFPSSQTDNYTDAGLGLGLCLGLDLGLDGAVTIVKL